jgi:4-amino-4-deoxy-L-arabinose transferase-like glycosyltransferase
MIGMTDNKRKKEPGDIRHTSFREFLSAYRIPILIILLVAFGWRTVLVIRFPHGADDEIRYTAPAVNMLAGRGFSSDVREPYLPSEHAMPLYPLFIAAVYAVFGENNAAVRIAQSAIDILTCLLVAFVSFTLAPPALRRSAAILALTIYGFLSWFTVFWTRYILTETLAMFLTMLAIAISIWASRGRPWRWLGVGAICGLAILTRADSVLLVFAFVLFLMVQIARLRSSDAVVSLLLFCSAIPLVLAPWIVRNYLAFEKFQPLASEWGRPRGEFVPTGYVLWIRTWMTDETNYHAGDLIFHPGSRAFDPRQLPDHVFDSVEEREEVFQLIDKYNQEGVMTPELSEKFRSLANQRIKRAPLRFYLWLPLKRAASMWLTGFVTSSRFRMLLRIALVLPILIGGVLGFAIFKGHQPLVQLLALIILTRTVFFACFGAEARYIVEAYPAVISACGLTGAALWRYLNLVRSKN